MQPMSHQVMGYDRTITMFSPDGRLLQVEYAKKTVKQGSSAIGVVCKDGVLFVADKRIDDKLIVLNSVEKLWKIDEHIGAAAAGIVSDARVLIERAQVRAQQHRVSYDAAIDVSSIVRDIAGLKQICTQSGGLRPFGVSTLFGGVDATGPRLFETDPTGIFFEYRAVAIGEGDTEIEQILTKEYKESMTIEEALSMSIKALCTVLEKKISAERIDAAYIGTDKKKYTRIKKAEIEKCLKGAR